mmetsp:Transcript_4478/g.7509  ORF Transcript_4478/g.7509 Transcript_4478/m.7509 type:complete len:90 (+) Transcript_4478:1101-1370(+)
MTIEDCYWGHLGIERNDATADGSNATASTHICEDAREEMSPLRAVDSRIMPGHDTGMGERQYDGKQGALHCRRQQNSSMMSLRVFVMAQ